MINAAEWTVLDEGGTKAFPFTSFLDIKITNGGQALSYPVEKGGFASYNKTQSPLNLLVTVGVQGLEADFDQTLFQLDKLKKEAVTLTVSSPATVYRNMTLQEYSLSRANNANAGMLVIQLTLCEVREVETQSTSSTISSPKNPTSYSKVNTGKTQPLTYSIQ